MTALSSKETDAPELPTFNLAEEELSDDSDFECEFTELGQLDPLDLPLYDPEEENKELQLELKELADELIEWAKMTNQTLDLSELLDDQEQPTVDKTSPIRRISLRERKGKRARTKNSKPNTNNGRVQPILPTLPPVAIPPPTILTIEQDALIRKQMAQHHQLLVQTFVLAYVDDNEEGMQDSWSMLMELEHMRGESQKEIARLLSALMPPKEVVGQVTKDKNDQEKGKDVVDRSQKDKEKGKEKEKEKEKEQEAPEKEKEKEKDKGKEKETGPAAQGNDDVQQEQEKEKEKVGPSGEKDKEKEKEKEKQKEGEREKEKEKEEKEQDKDKSKMEGQDKAKEREGKVDDAKVSASPAAILPPVQLAPVPKPHLPLLAPSPLLPPLPLSLPLSLPPPILTRTSTATKPPLPTPPPSTTSLPSSSSIAKPAPPATSSPSSTMPLLLPKPMISVYEVPGSYLLHKLREYVPKAILEGGLAKKPAQQQQQQQQQQQKGKQQPQQQQKKTKKKTKRVLSDDKKQRKATMTMVLQLFKPFWDQSLLLVWDNPYTAANSKSARLMFTPAEDSLLALGVQRFGKCGFEKIRESLLPTKTIKQLQNRYKNQTSSRAAPNPIKEVYNRLIKADQEPPALSELKILKQAVAVHGQEWETISVNCLPHRKPSALKKMWQALLDAERTASTKSKSRTIILPPSALSEAETLLAQKSQKTQSPPATRTTSTTTTTRITILKTTTTTMTVNNDNTSPSSSSSPSVNIPPSATVSIPATAVPMPEAFETEEIIDSDADDEDDDDYDDDVEESATTTNSHKEPSHGRKRKRGERGESLVDDEDDEDEDEEGIDAMGCDIASPEPSSATAAATPFASSAFPTFEEEVIHSDTDGDEDDDDEEEEDEEDTRGNGAKTSRGASSAQHLPAQVNDEMFEREELATESDESDMEIDEDQHMADASPISETEGVRPSESTSSSLSLSLSSSLSSSDGLAASKSGWTKEDDRLLLLTLQRSGSEKSTWEDLEKRLNKTQSELQLRYQQLMELFLNQNNITQRGNS